MAFGRVATDPGPDARTVAFMAGRHRRPPAWRRALSGRLGRRAGVAAARAAALQAEVIALRATVAALRQDLASAMAIGSELAGRLTAAESVAPAPPVTLELPLMRLAFTRESGPPLTRAMALALSTPDRGTDSARLDIVLADLPERPLLDPRVDRGSELRDLAGEIMAAPESVRRSA